MPIPQLSKSPQALQPVRPGALKPQAKDGITASTMPCATAGAHCGSNHVVVKQLVIIASAMVASSDLTMELLEEEPRPVLQVSAAWEYLDDSVTKLLGKVSQPRKTSVF